MWNLLQDSRYGLRLLARDPGFTLAAVLTLALGIGANTAIFSVINGIVVHALSYSNPDRLVYLTESDDRVPVKSFSMANFEDLRDQTKLFDAFVAYNGADHVLTTESGAERVKGRNVSSGMLKTFGLEPLMGRGFTPEDDKVGAARVVMLSEGFWTRRFARKPDIVGTHLTLSDESYEVVGIVPARLHGSWRDREVFLPLLRLADQIGGQDHRGMHPGIFVIGRMKPGVTEEQARAEVVALAKSLSEKYPRSNSGATMTLASLQEAVVGGVKPTLILLLLAVLLVLLIACANVANLLLGRAATRQRELAVRAAIGASRGRVIRQLLTESLILAGVGGALGLFLAYWGVAGILAMIPASAPSVEEIRVDGMVLLATAGITILTGLLFGLAPAWRISRTDPSETLKAGGRSGAAGASHHRLRGALVVAEVSLAIVLLIGAGLILRSFLAVLDADPGIRPEGVVVTQVQLPQARYGRGKEERSAAFVDQVLERTRALPGIRSAMAALPLMGGWSTSFKTEGQPEPDPGKMPMTDICRVSTDYFQTLGIPLIKGRVFTEQDRAGAPEVCVVDQTFERMHFPKEGAIGHRIKLDMSEKDPWFEIVGVVGHLKNYGVDQPSGAQTYVPFPQAPGPQFTLAVRSDRDLGDLRTALGAIVAGADPAVPTYNTARLESQLEDGRATRRITVVLLGVFAAVALLLAAVGIYGVISYSVSQRRQEIGIRMALGAERSQILGMVMRQGAVLAAGGIVIGLGVALGTSRLIKALLFQVTATDPPTFSAVPLILLAVATLAAYLPARRATRVEPMSALREE